MFKHLLLKAGLTEFDKEGNPVKRPLEMTNMDLTLKIKEIEMTMKNKFMEVNSSLHRINNVIEPMPDMKRELANNAISLLAKASNSDLTSLVQKVEAEYPTLRQFVQLQHTVGNKAEWQDVNDLIKQHN